VDIARHDLDGAEMTEKVRDKFIVIPRNVNDAGAFATGAQYFLDDVIVRLWPVNASTKLPYVDEVSDDVKFIEFVVAEELEQGIGLAPFGTEMNIGNPASAKTLHADSVAAQQGKRQTSAFCPAVNSPICHNTATRILSNFALLETMKSHVWDYALGHGFRPPTGRPPRRKTVTQILRAAYRKHVRDRHTRLAIKRCLR
jgi:hypothetical protein